MHLKLSGKEASNTGKAGAQDNTVTRAMMISYRNWNTSKSKVILKDLASIDALGMMMVEAVMPIPTIRPIERSVPVSKINPATPEPRTFEEMPAEEC